MKRRHFALMASCGVAAVNIGAPELARAGVPASRAALLNTTLTPFGSERAGNADGSIPDWTGGLTQTPPGWTEKQQPDYFADDALVLTIDSRNVAQFSDQLCDGLVRMINKYNGFHIQVYPTHRTAAAPDWVYKNIFNNALNSSLDPRGGRFGFLNAYGGIPFPILDSDPDVAGVQAIWNHLLSWHGIYRSNPYYVYTVDNGSVALGAYAIDHVSYPYYSPRGSVADFDGWYSKIYIDFQGPPVLVGQVLSSWSSSDPLNRPDQAWELLNGQGRVRKAPELTYDTPQSSTAGITNYDEVDGFYGSPDRYNWRYLGKREMFVPYNNNRLPYSDPRGIMGPRFIDPDVVRYEKHRVLVVDATLAPGERHTIPHRRFYLDEDTWNITYVDEYDAAGNYLKMCYVPKFNLPTAPVTVACNLVMHNLQTDQYSMGPGAFFNAAMPSYSLNSINPQMFNPQNIAASSQY